MDLEIEQKEKINCKLLLSETGQNCRRPVKGENASEKANCLVCGDEINYLNQPIKGICNYCGCEEESYFICKNGHFVCNECHSKDALKVIENVCLNTDLQDPMEIAEKIMEHPAIHMHGPEHHALVPAVIVTAYQNRIGEKKQKNTLEAIKRGSKIPGGYCGLYGACGAGLGVGIAVSILLEATPLTPDERSHANRATSITLNSIAEAGGARCCKKATRISLDEGINYLSELFDLDWYEKIGIPSACNYTQYNKECDRNCSYKSER